MQQERPFHFRDLLVVVRSLLHCGLSYSYVSGDRKSERVSLVTKAVPDRDRLSILIDFENT